MEKEIKKALISLGVFINILLTAACGHKTVDCDIEGKHRHKYRSDIGIERYISSEYDYVHNINDYTYYRTSDYVMLNEENEQLYSMISSNSLISIDGNKELLYNISDNLKDYYKFE